MSLLTFITRSFLYKVLEIPEFNVHSFSTWQVGNFAGIFTVYRAMQTATPSIRQSRFRGWWA